MSEPNSLDWIKRFEHHLAVMRNLAPNTVRGYVADVELLRRHFKLDDWAAFDEGMVAAYLTHLKDTSASDPSISRKLYSFRGFFRFLCKKGVVAADPWADVKFRVKQRKLPRTLSVGDMDRLINYIRQPVAALLGVPTVDVFLDVRDRAMLEVLYVAGLRVAELVGMNWEHIDLTKREVLVLGKGSKWRLVPLGQKAIDALLEYARLYREHWQRDPEGAAGVFLSTHGKRLDTRTLPRTLKKRCRLAGVPYIHPHGVRHSCATAMLDAGADLKIIQHMLGHVSIATTERYCSVATRQLKSVHANTHPRG